MSTQLRIDRARWWALSNQPFYGALAMSLQDVIDSGIESAHTDGRSITWNPDFVEKLTDEELRFVLLHETLHCAHQHMWRLPPDQLGNIAGDHEINLTLSGITGISMPEGGLADPQYAGLACEDILHRLGKGPEEPPDEPDDDDQDDDQIGDQIGDGWGSVSDSVDQSGEQGDQDGDQSGSPGDQKAGDDRQPAQPGDEEGEGDKPGGGDGDQDGDQDGDGKPGDKPGTGGQQQPRDPCGTFGKPADNAAQTPQEVAQASQQLRESWEGRVMQAAQAAQAAGIGDIPGDLQRVLDRLRHQGVDWRREMSDFVKDTLSQRNDWSRSARRHAWQRVIYPRKRTDDVGYVIFARDTSGSISDRVCADYTALITDCVSELGCTGLVLDVDTRIQAEYVLTGLESCPLTAKGGGGTDFRPVFQRAAELIEAGEHVAGVVYLTDLMGPFPETDPGIPTLWLSTDEYGRKYYTPPFGRIVPVEVGQ